MEVADLFCNQHLSWDDGNEFLENLSPSFLNFALGVPQNVL